MFGTTTLSEIKATLRAAREGRIKPTKEGRALARALLKVMAELEKELPKSRKPTPRPRANKR
jgi:hypothetical protein